MRYLRIGVLLAAAALSTGCLRMTYTLNLRPDGSGTIVQSIGMSKAAMNQFLAGIAGALEVKDATKPPSFSDLVTEDEARAQAAGMGEGVRFVSMKPLTGELEGNVLTYAFDDVSKLRLNIGGMMAGAVMGKSGLVDELPKDADLAVKFARDANGAVLVLTMPAMEPTAEQKKAMEDAQAAAAAGKAEKLPEVPPAFQEMMKEMMKGLFIEAAINIEGTITSTDAPYVEGSKVTLMQMDFEQLMKDMKTMQRLMEMQPAGDIGAMLNIPGMKVVTQKEVRIAFRR